MSGGSHIVAIGADDESSERQNDSAQAAEDALPLEDEWVEEEAYYEDEASYGGRWTDWIFPSVALLTIAGWTGLFGFVNHAEMLTGASLAQWTGWVSQWAMPVALIVAVWLLAMRSSKREQARFADTSRLLATESAGLESKLREVNRELSLAREFIASQSRDLESLGRVATERLSENAATLSGLIEQNGERIESIASVSSTALENMGKLRDDLPVISNSARDVTNQIGNAGRTAKSQLDEMIAGFKQLNEFGAASDQKVKAVQAHAATALSQLITQTDQLGQLAEQRFAALSEQSQTFRTTLDGHEVEALAAMKRRGETLSAEFETLRSDVLAREDEAISALRERIAALKIESEATAAMVRDGEVEAIEAWRSSLESVESDISAVLLRIRESDQAVMERSAEHLTQVEAHAAKIGALLEENSSKVAETLEARTQALAENEASIVATAEAHMASFERSLTERRVAMEDSEAALASIDERLGTRLESLTSKGAEISEMGERASASLSQAIDTLRGRFEEGRQALEGTDVVVAGLTDASVRLLELIQASAQHSQEILPAAIHNAQSSITHLQTQTSEMAEAIAGAEAIAQNAAQELFIAKKASDESVAHILAFSETHKANFAENEGSIAALKGQLEELDQRGDEVSKKLNEQLQPAVTALQAAMSKTLATVEASSATQIAKMANATGAASGTAIELAIKAKTAQAIADLENAAIQASSKSREATKQMRDQLAMVAELTSNLESRVAHARAMAQEQVDNDFARRVALITESLNSHAIDLSRAMSTDVTDTAWASYLKGDRGIFTRRAVSLLDKEETREIFDIYENDPDFREHVSRYIHDFEAMLRTLLSTRDGKAISVTLLSSDMGKLYVALAQAIERLRT